MPSVILAFLCALILGFVFSRAAVQHQKRPVRLELTEGFKLKLVTPSGAYRCFVEKDGRSGIVVSAPLHRDAYVPLRVGDLVLVQVATACGLMTFRTSVTERILETHSLVLAHPRTVRKTERRSYRRQVPLGDSHCRLNGVPSRLCDFSEFGAKIVSACPIEPGDAVIVELPDGAGEARGWALDSIPVIGQGRETRIRFEDPLVHLSSLRKV